MKNAIRSMLVAAALVTASAAGLAAAGEVAAGNGVSSVAEMMQRKQEHQLRAQLVAERRWDEVRLLDEKIAGRVRDKQEGRYTKTNEALRRSGSAEGPERGLLVNECDPETLRVR